MNSKTGDLEQPGQSENQISVTKQQLIAHARPGCPRCSGQGYYTFTPFGGQPQPEKICACALKRFAKRFRRDAEFRASVTTPKEAVCEPDTSATPATTV